MTEQSSGNQGTGAGGALLKYAPSRFVEPALALISLPFLTRILGTDEYGHLSVLLLTVGLIRNLAFDWVGNCGLRFRSVYADDLHRFFSNIAAGMVLSAAIGAAVLFSIRGLLAEGALVTVGIYAWWLFADAAASGLAFCGEGVLRACQRPVAFTISRIFQGVSRHILAVGGLYFMSADLTAYWGFRVLGLLLVSCWSWSTIGALRHLRLKSVSASTLREFFWFGFPLAVALLATALRGTGNRYVVLWFDGAGNTGLFSAAANLGGAPMVVFQQIVMLGLYPLAIKAWDRGDSIIPIVRDGLRYFFLAALPALVGLAMLAEPVLQVVAGPEYGAAWPVLGLLAAAAFVYGLSQYFSLQFMVAKRTGVMAGIGVVTGILNLALSVALVPRYGYQVAALTTVVANIFLLAGMMIWGLKPWREAIPGRALGRVLLSVAAMAVVVRGLDSVLGVDSLPKLLITIAVGIATYGVVLWRTGEITHEIKIAGQLLNRGRAGANHE